MYKSAYMVQIMRSKRSIKEEGKEEKQCTLYPTSKNAAEQERSDYITLAVKITQSCSGAVH